VELLLILYQNLMLGLLVLQHDDLLTWRSRRRIKWLLCNKAGGVKDGGWVWVDVVGGGVRNEGDVEDKTDCVCGWKKCVCNVYGEDECVSCVCNVCICVKINCLNHHTKIICKRNNITYVQVDWGNIMDVNLDP
jgi:hypothetical protein